MSIAAIIVYLIIAGALGFIVGNHIGYAEGRNVQWVDDWLAQARREAARRDKLGRFKERNT
jgi:hypothetical protein